MSEAQGNNPLATRPADGASPHSFSAEAPDVAIITFDIDGQVLFVNSEFVALSGLPADVLERGSLKEVYERSRQVLSGPMRDAPFFDPGEQLAAELTLTLVDGRILKRQALPVLDGVTQQLVGHVLSFTDVTAQQNAQVALSRSVELEKQREAELESARRATAVACEVRRAFLARMSHELRTPLNAILGFSQLLALDPHRSLTPEQSRHIEQIIRGGDMLLELIDKMLDLARVEADQLELKLHDLDAQPLVHQCVEALLAKASLRKVRLLSSVSTPVHVRADPARLRQVLMQLLGNAIKFNREGGLATVTAYRAGDMFRFEVTDTGLGIPADQQARLFMPFDRLGVVGGSIEGAGVGLAVAHHFVEKMGGQIGVQSEPAAGSTFWFTLPAWSAAVQ